MFAIKHSGAKEVYGCYGNHHLLLWKSMIAMESHWLLWISLAAMESKWFIWKVSVCF
jgi:hypothetical protein